VAEPAFSERLLERAALELAICADTDETS